MSHHIYTTDAFVLESGAGKEADKVYTLFTQELGMVRASAQGVRLLKSKLRFSMQDFSLSTVSIVRGKEWWRVVNAVPILNLFTEYKSKKYLVYTFARIFRLLRRLIPEEEKNEPLFTLIIDAIDYIKDHAEEPKQVVVFEYIIALRILNLLGYVSLQTQPELQQFISEPLSEALIQKGEPYTKQFVTLINASIRESHL
jgi:DNA repair protein RecO